MYWLMLMIYGVMSAITFMVYGWDKRRAMTGGWRVRESALHMLELLGGWPGAMAGRAVFRHKGRKVSYRSVFALIVVAHVLAWALVMWGGGLGR